MLLRDVIVFALRTGRATRVGFTVSGKVGNAVARNRVKRRLREGWRRLWVEGPGGWDVVVIAKRSAVACEYNELAAQLDRVKRRLAEWG